MYRFLKIKGPVKAQLLQALFLFLIKQLFYMRVPLESIDFYVKLPKTGENNFLGHY
jgi:hypothetical protein